MAEHGTRRIRLDIGGEEIVVVSPDLFCVAGNNRLSDMTARCDDPFARCDDAQSDWDVFVDYSPDVFVPLLNWLRHFRDSERDEVIDVVVEPRYRPPFIRMMIFLSYGLNFIRLAGIKAGELLDRGYSYEDLLDAGFEESELPPPVLAEARQRVCNLPQPSSSLQVDHVIHCKGSIIPDKLRTKILQVEIGGQKNITVSPDLFGVAGENRLSKLLAECCDPSPWNVESSPDMKLFVDYSPEVFMPLVDWLRRFRDSQRDRRVCMLVEQPYRAPLIRMMISLSFELWYLRLADIHAVELLERGYGHESLLDAGFQETELPRILDPEEENQEMPSGDSLEVYTGSSRSDLVLYSNAGVPEGVLRINIGGQKLVAVSLELLMVAGESKLSVMVSGRWAPPTDADGNYFVDYAPEVFIPLVDWLRHFRDSSRDQVIPAVVEKQHRTAWIRMMIALSFELCYLRLAGIEPIELLNLGYSEEVLLDAGFEMGRGRWDMNNLSDWASWLVTMVTGKPVNASS